MERGKEERRAHSHTETPHRKTFFSPSSNTHLPTGAGAETSLNATHIDNEDQFKAEIVHLVISQETETALELLSQHYHVITPKLKVGMPKSDLKHQGCYVVKNATIHVANSDNLINPYIILHEFYHHLRTSGAVHRGTEKNADKFAKTYIATYYTHTGTPL